jgi:DNA adenine methylase
MTNRSHPIPTYNVSSVKLRSPFRYPGGKTWLVPLIRQWLRSIEPTPSEFIEPFAGGAIVGLTVAFERLADHVMLVELDEQVGAVWETIITKGRGNWLARKIEEFDLTVENAKVLLARKNLGPWQRAFQTIVHNRVSHGGIIAEGAGLLKEGENGKGIASRWYPKTLSKRIRNIHKIRERLSFVRGDGLQVIEQNRGRSDVVFFIDPPYTTGNGKQAGQRLYTHSELDHERLFEVMETIQGDFLMTYENDKDIRKMATRRGFDTRPVAMKSTHHAQMTELLIGRDLGWIS